MMHLPTGSMPTETIPGQGEAQLGLGATDDQRRALPALRERVPRGRAGFGRRIVHDDLIATTGQRDQEMSVIHVEDQGEAMRRGPPRIVADHRGGKAVAVQGVEQVRQRGDPQVPAPGRLVELGDRHRPPQVMADDGETDRPATGFRVDPLPARRRAPTPPKPRCLSTGRRRPPGPTPPRRAPRPGSAQPGKGAGMGHSSDRSGNAVAIMMDCPEHRAPEQRQRHQDGGAPRSTCNDPRTGRRARPCPQASLQLTRRGQQRFGRGHLAGNQAIVDASLDVPQFAPGSVRHHRPGGKLQAERVLGQRLVHRPPIELGDELLAELVAAIPVV